MLFPQDAVIAADREIHEAQLELRQSQRQEEGIGSKLIDSHAVSYKF